MRRTWGALWFAAALAGVTALAAVLLATAATLRGWMREQARRYRVTGRHRPAVAPGSQAQRRAVDPTPVRGRPWRWAGAHVQEYPLAVRVLAVRVAMRAAVVVAC